MAKKTDRRGGEAFDRHFADVYGQRWPTLRAALEAPSQPEDHLEGLLKPYFLDASSVRAAQALAVQPGDAVLDLCAAPGGKTLVLALALAGTGSLVSNDRSADRRGRLKKVIEEHLPAEWRSNIQVTGHDASRWGLHEQNVYDRILLDAPCSSERHVLQSPKHLADWSPGRTKTLAQQALAMLCSALEALKPGGVLAYCTCSISPEENDRVLERFATKRPGRWELLERTLTLPDDAQGEGPLFFAVLRKKAPT